MIFGPGNHEIGNTTKFRCDDEKRMADSESATQKLFRNDWFYFSTEKKFHFVDMC